MVNNKIDWSKECILLADSDYHSHILIERVAEKMGASVVHAYNGNKAVNCLLENSEISIALIDVVLPDIDGIQVVSRAKAYSSKVSFFAYTAHVLYLERIDMLEMGFLKCFVKPIIPAKLFSEISAFLPENIDSSYK